jgi:lactoylglutathione lyase
MKFCWVTLSVADLEKSMDFYTKVVGLTVDRKVEPSPKMKIAFLGSGETKVELIYDQAGVKKGMGEGISIGFEVESIESFMKLLKERGIPVASGPHQPNPSIRFIYVLDPDGLRVQFVENIKRP